MIIVTALILIGCTGEEPMTGPRYFELAYDQIELADRHFLRIGYLDECDSSEAQILASVDSCIAYCDKGVAEMNAPTDMEFPYAEELRTKTVAWLEGMKALCNDHIIDMAESLSKPEDIWSSEEYDALFAYTEAYEAFQKVDADWVAFQSVYAEANDITLLE